MLWVHSNFKNVFIIFQLMHCICDPSLVKEPCPKDNCIQTAISAPGCPKEVPPKDQRRRWAPPAPHPPKKVSTNVTFAYFVLSSYFDDAWFCFKLTFCLSSRNRHFPRLGTSGLHSLLQGESALHKSVGFYLHGNTVERVRAKYPPSPLTHPRSHLLPFVLHRCPNSIPNLP